MFVAAGFDRGTFPAQIIALVRLIRPGGQVVIVVHMPSARGRREARQLQEPSGDISKKRPRNRDAVAPPVPCSPIETRSSGRSRHCASDETKMEIDGIRPSVGPACCCHPQAPWSCTAVPFPTPARRDPGLSEIRHVRQWSTQRRQPRAPTRSGPSNRRPPAPAPHDLRTTIEVIRTLFKKTGHGRRDRRVNIHVFAFWRPSADHSHR